CRRMTASLVVELKALGALGVASELGGTTSHGLLLARALGIPAVTGVSDLVRHALAGEPLIVDGNEGVVILRPSPDTLSDYAARREKREGARRELLAYRTQPAITADGIRFKLQA